MLLTTRCVCAHGSLELVRGAAAARIGGKLLMYGVSMLFGLMTGLESRRILHASCIGMMIFGKVVSRSLTLGLGFVVHMLI